MKSSLNLLYLFSLISFINSHSLESLWELSLKEIKSGKKNKFLIDPDNLVTSKELSEITYVMDELYDDFSCYSYLFIVKQIDNKDLSAILTQLEKKIKSELPEKKFEKLFLSIISVNDNIYKYEYSNFIKKIVTEFNKGMMKNLTERKMASKEYGSAFKSQLQEIRTVVDPEHEDLDWWNPHPYAPTDPDDVDREEDYPDVQPTPNPSIKKKNEPIGRGFYITVIICLILLIVFLVWLFYSLAKRVKKMSSNSIDYTMFPNGQESKIKI